MKLIRTKLLLKHNHNSAVGIATASHIDFCKYQFRCLRPQWSCNEYMNILVMFIELFFCSVIHTIFSLNTRLTLISTLDSESYYTGQKDCKKSSVLNVSILVQKNWLKKYRRKNKTILLTSVKW